MNKLFKRTLIICMGCIFMVSGYSNIVISKSGHIEQKERIAKAEVTENSQTDKDYIINNGTIEQTVNSWATAFCGRNGNMLYQLYDPDNRKDFYKIKYVNSSLDNNEVLFGISSPWPWETNYEYNIEGNTAEITYSAMTSEPHVYIWIEKVNFAEKDHHYYVSSEQLKEYDSISSKEEFDDTIYGNFRYYGNKLNYLSTGLGYQLNQNAVKDKNGFYADLFSPTTAAPYLLNLSGGNCVVKKKYLTCTIVTYTFKNGTKIDIQMSQPFGKRGIWLVEDTFDQFQDHNLLKIEQWYQKLNIKKLNKIKTVINTYEIGEVKEGSTILLAAIPKEKLYMYGYGQGNAVILRINNNYQLFCWRYTSPRCILPKIGYADYDKDGKKEIAISLHTDTGTGVSVEHLQLVKMQSDGTMQAQEFTKDQYLSIIKEKVTGRLDETTGILQFYIDNKMVGKSDLSSWLKEGYQYSGIAFGDQISFRISKKGITMNFTPGAFFEQVCTLLYDDMPDFTANVLYQNGEFSLSDIKITKTE